MAIKAERLAQRIQEIRSFATDRTQHNELFDQVVQSLDQIAIATQQKKLTLHWINGHTNGAASNFDVLKTKIEQHPLLAEFYQIQTFELKQESAWKDALDCDVLCLVQPEAGLSSLEQQFLYQAGSAVIAKQFVILEESQIDGEKLTALKTIASEANFEVVVLPLQELSPFSTGMIATHNSRKTDLFLKGLESLVRRKPEDILAKRMAAKVLLEIARLEQFFAIAAEAVDQQIQSVQQHSHSMQGNPSNELKNQFEQNFRQAQDTSKLWFKQLRSEIEQSKNQLLDEFNRQSLHHQIHLFVNRLQPALVRNGNAKYVQLQANFVTTSTDVNLDMIQLCYACLNQWAIAEWQRIYSIYNGGGMSYIFQHIYSLMNVIPSIALNATEFQPGQQPFLLKSFKQPIATLPCESYFKEASLWNYLIRQLRNQWMGIMFLITFVTVIGIAPNKRQFIQSIFVPFNFLKEQPVALTVALAIPLCLLFLWLFHSYDNDSETKVIEEADKLRKSLRDYYQKFARYATEKMVVDFDEILNAEERQLYLLLEIVRDRAKLHLAVLDQQTSLVQQELQRLVLQQKDLERVRSELHKFKQM